MPKLQEGIFIRYSLTMITLLQQQEMQNDGKSAAASRSAYTASVVRMEELRDINKVSLTPQEVKARDLEMQRSRRTLVSGDTLFTHPDFDHPYRYRGSCKQLQSVFAPRRWMPILQ